MEEGPATMTGRGGAAGGGDAGRLPEECISWILSLTSPLDVCRSSTVSSVFRSAAESDLVWDRFLPPDWEGILRRASCSSVTFSSRRELYFRLCDSIPIDGGSKRVWLEKPTGKKCYMLSARALGITWGEDDRYWRWISVPDARFPEVAELLDVCWLEIQASISTRDLSPGTIYGAYLVMRLTGDSSGLDDPPQETVITVGGVPSSTRRVRLQEQNGEDPYDRLRRRVAPPDDLWWFQHDEGGVEEEEGEEEEEAPAMDTGSPDEPLGGGVGEDDDDEISNISKTSSSTGPHEQVGRASEGGEGITIWVPGERKDGWMELGMGDFFIEAGGEELVDVTLNGWQGGNWKSGLIVHGIELRPMP